MAKYSFPQNTNIYLTNMLQQYRNPSASYIGDLVAPRTPVGSETFKWLKRNKGDAFLLPTNMDLSKMSPFPSVDFGFTDMTGTTNDYGVSYLMSNKDQEEAKLIGLDNVKMMHLQALIDLVDIKREKDTRDAIFTAANYTNKSTLSGTSQWSDYVNSNPITEIKTQMQKNRTGFSFNTIAMGGIVWYYLARHPKVISYVLGSTISDGIVTQEAFGRALGLRVVVGEAQIATNVKGQTTAIADIWENKAALLVVNPNMTVLSGMGFALTAQVNYGSYTRLVLEDQIIPGEAGLYGATKLYVGESAKPLVVASDMGFLWTDATASTI